MTIIKKTFVDFKKISRKSVKYLEIMRKHSAGHAKDKLW